MPRGPALAPMMRRNDDGPLPSPHPNNLPRDESDDDDPSRHQGQEEGGTPLAAVPHDREGDGDADADTCDGDGDDATATTRTMTMTAAAAAEARDVGFRVGVERGLRAGGIAMINKSPPQTVKISLFLRVPTYERSN